MSNRCLCGLIYLLSALATGTLDAQLVFAPAPGYTASYSEIRTWHRQQSQLETNPTERVENLRKAVHGRYGQTGLERAFRNLSGRYSIDPTIPGFEDNLLRATSDNPSYRKGYLRTHLYATKIHNSPDFKLLAVNEVQRSADGRLLTDKDIRYQHTATGTIGRIEVKEWKTTTQRADWSRAGSSLRRQIDLMANEYRRTGELQMLASRNRILPEIRRYAEQRGILVRDNVVTGDITGRQPGNLKFDQMMDDLKRRHSTVARIRSIGGATKGGFGVLLVITAMPSLSAELSNALNPETRTTATLLRLGEKGNLVASGTAMTVSSGAQLAATHVKDAKAEAGRLRSRLTRLGRWSGGVAVVTFLASEGFTVAQYHQGYLTERQFAHGQATLIAGAGGAAAGAWAGGVTGATIGSAVGVWFFGAGAAPGAAIGGTAGSILGGIAGAYGGSQLADYGMTRWFQLHDEQQATELRKFVYNHYDVPLR